MKLSELVAKVNGLQRDASQSVGDVEIQSVIDDSRVARPGALFVARAGSKEQGAAFIEAAVRAGVSALVVAMDDAIPPGVVAYRCVNPSAMLAPLAHAFAGFPSKH